MPPRPRYEGEVQSLVSVLSPFVVSAPWFHYNEGTDAKVKAHVLVAHRNLFRALTQLCPNLAFKKGTMIQAFVELQRSKNFPELDNSERRADWVETMCVRLRNACRHVSHARCKKVPPGSLLLLILLLLLLLLLRLLLLSSGVVIITSCNY